MPLTPSQQEAVCSAHEPLFIQAGAGTGKTFTLTKRIAHGLSSQSGPLIGGVDRLLTITFTNKAAGELIGRVRSELRAQGLSEESLQIDAAWISTIHAMCRRMLLAHAFDVQVDPGASMLTEDETRALSALALDDLLKSGAEDPRLVLLNANYGVDGATRLIAAVSSLLELAPGGRADFDLGPQPPSARDAASAIVDLLVLFKEALAQLDAAGIDLGKKTYRNNYEAIFRTVEIIDEYVSDGGQVPSWAGVGAVLDACPPVKGGNFKDPFKGLFATCKTQAAQVATQTRCALSRACLDAALELAELHLQAHRALKRARGALDTNDLLIATYRMLADDDDVARAYREGFDSVMVDEFQDTDDLQVGIVGKLCPPDLSTLATVGDAQQSIYGFRGADLEVYQRTRELMRARGSNEVDLTVNYRSQPDILRFVEDIFSKPEFFGGGFLKVSSGRAGGAGPTWLPADEPRVKILLSAGHAGERGARTSVTCLREADAHALADEFERLHAQGASYGDMAILLQSTKVSKSGPYLRELRRRGIPCIISGGSDFFCLPEVELVCMLLRVIADRDDDEALFTLLGSDFFDVSDDDLLALSVASRQRLKLLPEEMRFKPSLYDALRFLVDNIPDDAGAVLASALAVIDQVLEDAHGMPLAHVVRNAVARSGWKATLAHRGVAGGAVFANVERACDMIESFEQANGHGPFAVSRYFCNMIELAREGVGARAKLGTLVSSRSDAVQIMTIHSSKGLEFPIVAVAEFEKSARGGDVQVMSLSEEGTRYLALSTAGIDDADESPSLSGASDVASFQAGVRQLKRQRDEEEQQRLLYVALTRARDKLIVMMHDGTFASKGDFSTGLAGACMHAVFGEELPTQDATVRTQAGALVQLAITDVPHEQAAGQDDDGPGELEVPFVGHCDVPRAGTPRISAQATPRAQLYSYTSIAHRDAMAIAPVAAAVTLRDRSQDADTVSGVGSAFHLVAQWLATHPNAGAQLVEQRLESAARRYRLGSEERDRMAQAVVSWVTSRRYAQVQEHARRHAEYAFCVDVRGVPLEGFIDLVCFDDDGGALVIDYKTGTSGAGDELRERYALQAHCYCYALLSSGACDHVEMVFVRPEALMEEVVFEYSVDDLTALADRILES